jgi:murein DD-endopeptidase MepM/ murein hydrolase activator NlpD
VYPPDQLGRSQTGEYGEARYARHLEGVNRIHGKDIALFAWGFALGALTVTVLVWRTDASHSERVQADRGPRHSAPESEPLERRGIGLPIAGLTAKDIQDTFYQLRDGTRPHEATDILAPRGTPVLAVDAGTVKKLFTSKAGGLTIYQFDPEEIYCYYYAHLDRYATGLREGVRVKRGDLIGYVGTTGNAPRNTPHLHFAIFKIGPDKRWWDGTPINAYPLLIEALRPAEPDRFHIPAR